MRTNGVAILDVTCEGGGGGGLHLTHGMITKSHKRWGALGVGHRLALHTVSST